MRVALSEQPWTGGSNPGDLGNGGSGSASKYEIGETEDYFFVPDKTSDKNCPLCQDVDGNGVSDGLEPSQLQRRQVIAGTDRKTTLHIICVRGRKTIGQYYK